jgi:hypothetical protein
MGILPTLRSKYTVFGVRVNRVHPHKLPTEQTTLRRNNKMKFNKWTVGLAAVGAVSLASVARAEEHAVMTALANTTISGYVNTSVQWNWGSPKSAAPLYAFAAGKNDGFNLNVVKLTLEKPMDESDWAAGYKVDLLYGPDAVGWNPSANGDATSDFAIKQAYVALRLPVAGNGIDLKIGTFDTIIGYEVFDAGSNPNFTRSYGYTLEPTEHTGILASYKVNDHISVSAGVANTLTAGINTRAFNASKGTPAPWRKTVMGAVALTAPDDWGFIGGSTLYAGVVHGFAGGTEDTSNYYVGAAVKTPVKGLTVGLAYDHIDNAQAIFGTGAGNEAVSTYGLYTSYQATEKLSVHGRAEWVDGNTIRAAFGQTVEGMALTGTLQYDLWANVLSRLEVRWDRSFGKPDFFAGFNSPDYVTVLANIIYKF